MREYARAHRGKQLVVDIKGKRGKRTSSIAAYLPQKKELIAPLIFQGYTNTSCFINWVKECLLPALRPGQTIIMDNASFHKNSKIKDLIESAGCTLLYLPVYSPDFNPIEKIWALLKKLYRTFKKRGYDHNDALTAAFRFV